MNRRSIGACFIGIAAFLYGVRYLTAAIFASNVQGWSRETFRAMLEYVGNGPVIASVIALVVGIGYLAAAEFEPFMKRNAEQIKRDWNEFPFVEQIKKNWNEFPASEEKDKR